MIQSNGGPSLPHPIASQTVTYYINRQSGRYHETVDQYETKAEALKMVPEYQLSEHGRAFYYVSTQPRANWQR